MSASLRKIEKAMVTLWMNRRAREKFLHGSGGKKSAKTAIDTLPSELRNDIDKRGVSLYANLLNFGHHDVMESIYPGCAKILGEKWERAVGDYLERFPPNHYNFNRTAERFAEFLEKHGDRYLKKYPYLAELADYEWLELEILEKDVEVTVSPHQTLTQPEQFASLAPVVNPSLVVRHYRYPITDIVDHLHDDCCLPSAVEPEATSVAVYRHPDTHLCKFLRLGALAARVVEVSAESRQSYSALVALVVSLSGGRDPQQSVVEFLELIDKIQSLYLLVGSEAVATNPRGGHCPRSGGGAAPRDPGDR